MSMRETDDLLEQLEVAFDEACAEGNIELARKIINEVKDINVLSAKILESELLSLPLSNFIK